MGRIERNGYAARMKTAEDAARDLRVDLAASYNDIQIQHDEANARETDLWEAREELRKVRFATESMNTQLNEERGQSGERRQEREAVAVFIDTVLSHLNDRDEWFRDELNTLVATYKRNINMTTVIYQTMVHANICT